MHISLRYWCISTFLLLLVRFSSAQVPGTPHIPNVAVSDLTPHGVSASDAAIITERLRTELLSTKRFRVMERSQMDQILKEQAFQKSGACDNSECAVEVGKLLSVDRMIVGDVGKIGSLYTTNVRLLDVGTGEVLFSTGRDFNGPIEDLLTESVPQLARELAGASQRTGGVAIKQGFGDLYVTTSDPKAALTLDGVPVAGRSPFTIEKLKAGVHALIARTADHFGSMTVDLDRDDLKKVFLEMHTGEGQLKVFSEPPGANVVLDGSLPLGETPLRANHIAAGVHQMTFSLPGHFSGTKNVLVGLDELVEIRDTLPPQAVLNLSSTVGGINVSLTDGHDTLYRTLATANTPLPVVVHPGTYSLRILGIDWELPIRTYTLGAEHEVTDTLRPISRWGELHIETNVPALISWNGDTLGRTFSGWHDALSENFLTSKVPAGRGRLCASANRYATWCDSLSVDRGENTVQKMTLQAAWTGLDVRANVEADLWLDDSKLGKVVSDSVTVAHQTYASFEEKKLAWATWEYPVHFRCDTLKPGRKMLRLEAPGYESWKTEINLTNGTTTSLLAMIKHPKAWDDSVAHAYAVRWRWITGISAAASAVVAGYFFGVALHEKSQADDARSAYSASRDPAAETALKQSYSDHIDKDNDARHASLAAGIVTAVLAAGCGVTYAF